MNGNLNLTPLGLLRVLSALNLNLPINPAQNPLVQSTVTSESTARFMPQLETGMASGVKQETTPKQTVYATNPTEVLAQLLFSNLPSITQKAVPEGITPSELPVSQSLSKYLVEGLLADLTASQLKSQLDALREQILSQMSKATSTTENTPSPSVALTQAKTTQASSSPTPSQTPTANIASNLQEQLGRGGMGVSLLKNLQNMLSTGQRIPSSMPTYRGA